MKDQSTIEKYEEALQKIAHYPYYDFETKNVRDIARTVLGEKFIKTEDDLD